MAKAPAKRPVPADKALAVPATPMPTAELGVSGTTIYAGRIQSETNTALQHERAYGQPGLSNWGEWERVVRTDPACASALDMIVSRLRDGTVSIAYPEGHEGNQAIADYARANLLEWLEPAWPEFLGTMCRGFLSYGFWVGEPVFGLREDKRISGGIGYFVKKIADRRPSSIKPNGWFEKDGELAEIHQYGIKDGSFQSPILPANRVLLISWNREGSNYQGFSAFRPVWYLVKLREQLLKIIGIGHQREACGIPVATMEKDVPLTKGQRRSIQKLLENSIYHENAAVTLPPGVKLDWFYSPGANKGHVLETWRQLGIAIHEVVQTQQIALGTGETGSRSVGEVHDSSKDAFVTGVKGMVEGTMNGVGSRPYTGLLRKLIDANFGPQEVYPRLSIELKASNLSPKDFSDAVGAASKNGVITLTSKDENIVRKAIGLPAITDEEREAEQEKKLETQRAMMEATAPAEDDEEEKGAPKKKKPFGGPPRRFADSVVFEPWRELRPNEKVVAFAEIDDQLTRAKAEFADGARPLLVEALASALPDIRAAMADGDPSEVAKLELKLDRLGDFIGTFIDRLRALGYRHVRQERSTGTVVARLADASDQVKKVLRPMREALLRRMRARMIADIERRAIDVVRTGGDPSEVVSEVVQSTLETSALKIDAGTVVSKAFNIGREEFARDHGDEVEAVTLSAILDRNTCEACRDLDGESFEFGSPEHDRYTPPLRDCEGQDACRCILIYEFSKPGFQAVEE